MVRAFFGYNFALILGQMDVWKGWPSLSPIAAQLVEASDKAGRG